MNNPATHAPKPGPGASAQVTDDAIAARLAGVEQRLDTLADTLSGALASSQPADNAQPADNSKPSDAVPSGTASNHDASAVASEATFTAAAADLASITDELRDILAATAT